MEKVHTCTLSGLHEWNLASRLPYLIWGFQHVVGFRRRHVGASIQEAWTTSLEDIRAALDADPSADRTLLLRATTQELGPTREAVIDAVTQRVDLSIKQATEAYTVAEQCESNPGSVWGYVQGLTRVSQRTPWQDGRFALDRAAGRLLRRTAELARGRSAT
jgi:hypothetical protein